MLIRDLYNGIAVFRAALIVKQSISFFKFSRSSKFHVENIASLSETPGIDYKNQLSDYFKAPLILVC